MLNLMTDGELAACPVGDDFVFDIEVFPNFVMVAFRHKLSGKIVILEQREDERIDLAKLSWILYRFRLTGFNSSGYDLLITAGILQGASCATIYEMSQSIIVGNLRRWDFENHWKLKIPDQFNHIDLQEVVPLTGSLKMRMSQMHAETIQDLPFEPGTKLTSSQMTTVRLYCGNDLAGTQMLADALSEQLKLRETMGKMYGVDLRSKSDAQIAESVISQKLATLRGSKLPRPPTMAGKVVCYRVPPEVKFETVDLQNRLTQLATHPFEIDAQGNPMPPDWLGLPIRIGSGVYRMGAGGLHSTEERVSYQDCDGLRILDRDVASYYPSIIINQRLFPSQLGEAFLDVYASILADRLAAKKRGDKPMSESLKIVVNGSFGKFGSKWSLLYAPQLLLQVTLSGQLYLLMLIERLEADGIQVISANTDGIVMLCPQRLDDAYQRAILWWEGVTSLVTEETRYQGYYARDVNNYVAVKPDGEVKAKGAFSNPWKENSIFRFHKNPTAIVCVEALHAFLNYRIPISDSIEDECEPHKFATVRKVKGGAEKDGESLGRVARWYWSKSSPGPITYVENGNAVADSDNGQPMMRLPLVRPDDVDLGEYIRRTEQMLTDVGFRFRRTLVTG